MDIGSPKIEETFDLTLDLLFSYQGLPELLCLCFAIFLYYVGFLNIIWKTVRSLIIQIIMLLIMLLTITLTCKYVSVSFLDFVDCSDGDCTMEEILGKIVVGQNKIWSGEGLEMCSDLLILICFITIINGYLYKRLPYSLIPNWIPLIGLADEAIVNAFQVMASLGICALVWFQMKHTSSTYTHRFSLHTERAWKQSSEFVVELSLAEKIQVCFGVFLDIHQWLVAILGW